MHLCYLKAIYPVGYFHWSAINPPYKFSVWGYFLGFLEKSISVGKRTASFLVQKHNLQQNREGGSTQLDKCERVCIQSKRTFSLRLFPHPKACQKKIKDWNDIMLQLCSSHSHPCCELIHTNPYMMIVQHLSQMPWLSLPAGIRPDLPSVQNWKNLWNMNVFRCISHTSLLLMWPLAPLVVEPASLEIAS